ncbi:MFS transporter [Demequina sp. NBRC 110051]|uniref:MFS transporter n=1 Tax=Demequina sp. NBRC 110051 TaxID=1570340 RepID=UPI00190EE863|nr:MFS transporter [Demequina sp. NBRC 110051]
MKDPVTRTYLIFSAMGMMGDNIEHVITYWVLWETFHSPWLVGFQVVSHWLPFLLFSIPFGRLADHHDPRRVIQTGQALFMAVSVAWGVLFLTGTLEMWMACVLLVFHGMAGAMWGPSEQVLLHSLVGRDLLPGAVRMNATFKSLGVVLGPAIGSVLLFGLGPGPGILVNVLFYLPLTIMLVRIRFTRDAPAPGSGPARSRAGWRDTLATFSLARRSRPIAIALILALLMSLLIGASLQSAMPAFAEEMGLAGGVLYSLLLVATALGGAVGGFLLEATRVLPPTPRVAVVSTLVYAVALLGFALSPWYAASLLMLFISGAAAMATNSTTTAIVQLEAPAEQRGRAIGLFGMAGQGSRTFGGITFGALGAALGVHAAFTLNAAVLALACLAMILVAARRR